LADVNAKTIYDAIERSDRIGIYSGGPRAPRLFFIRRDPPDFIAAGGTGFMLVEAVLTIARRCAAEEATRAGSSGLLFRLRLLWKASRSPPIEKNAV
jgi:hypothetical protein